VCAADRLGSGAVVEAPRATLNALASEHGVHPNQIGEWKRQLLAIGSTLFSRDGAHHQREPQEREVELYEQIGRLKMELEWLKKKAARFS
jgi:putative transposase